MDMKSRQHKKLYDVTNNKIQSVSRIPVSYVSKLATENVCYI